MDQVNIIVAIIYFTSLLLIINKMIQSLSGLVTVRVNEESLKTQLNHQELGEDIVIKFDFAEQYKFEPLQELSISITNKLSEQSLYINWEQCTLTDLKQNSRRIIRFNSEVLLDLLPAQTFSVIAPNQTLKAKLTSEDVLKRSEKGGLEIASPLFDLKTLKKASEKGEKFTLQLVFQIIKPRVNPRNIPISIISCEFIIEKMPFQKAIIWKPKKKKKKD